MPQKIISVGMIPEDWYHMAPHIHDMWELVYYTSGCGENTVGGAVYSFAEGTLLCQPPGVPHSERSDEGFRNIHVCVNEMDDFGMAVPHYTDGANRECRQLFLQLHHVFHQRGPNHTGIMDGILALLMEYLYSYGVQTQKSPLVEQCEQVIIENIENADFALSAYIGGLPLSPTYFMKLFKKETGQTPAGYLTDKRMDYARRLLSNRRALGLRVRDVARRCGYEDPYYFSRAFKRYTGMAPEIMFP